MYSIDASKELIIIPNESGIQLIKPVVIENIMGKDSLSQLLSVNDVLQMPHSVYFLNNGSTLINMNQISVEICKYDSIQDAIGKNPSNHNFDEESAQKILKSHNKVVQKKQLDITDDTFLLEDGTELNCLSIVRPVLDEQQESIGIFGMTILYDQHSLADSLLSLSASGLLNINSINYKRYLTNYSINSIVLSKQETNCLKHYVAGKTTKEIAKILTLSPRTVESYLLNIKSKLGVNSKSELIALAIENGF